MFDALPVHQPRMVRACNWLRALNTLISLPSVAVCQEPKHKSVKLVACRINPRDDISAVSSSSHWSPSLIMEHLKLFRLLVTSNAWGCGWSLKSLPWTSIWSLVRWGAQKACRLETFSIKTPSSDVKLMLPFEIVLFAVVSASSREEAYWIALLLDVLHHAWYLTKATGLSTISTAAHVYCTLPWLPVCHGYIQGKPSKHASLVESESRTCCFWHLSSSSTMIGCILCIVLAEFTS